MFDSEKPRPGMPPAGASSLTRLWSYMLGLSGKRTRYTDDCIEQARSPATGRHLKRGYFFETLKRTARLAWVVGEVADP